MTVNNKGVAPSLDAFYYGVDGRTWTYTMLPIQVIYFQVYLLNVLALNVSPSGTPLTRTPLTRTLKTYFLMTHDAVCLFRSEAFSPQGILGASDGRASDDPSRGVARWRHSSRLRFRISRSRWEAGVDWRARFHRWLRSWGITPGTSCKAWHICSGQQGTVYQKWGRCRYLPCFSSSVQCLLWRTSIMLYGNVKYNIGNTK